MIALFKKKRLDMLINQSDKEYFARSLSNREIFNEHYMFHKYSPSPRM